VQPNQRDEKMRNVGHLCRKPPRTAMFLRANTANLHISASAHIFQRAINVLKSHRVHHSRQRFRRHTMHSCRAGAAQTLLRYEQQPVPGTWAAGKCVARADSVVYRACPLCEYVTFFQHALMTWASTGTALDRHNLHTALASLLALLTTPAPLATQEMFYCLRCAVHFCSRLPGVQFSGVMVSVFSTQGHVQCSCL
jgi:hypothetical protein